MENAWPDPVERVAAFLREAGAEARLEQFDAPAPTARAAAEAIGCALDQIVKSLVLVCDGVTVVALVPGDRRGDIAKIARLTGAEQVQIAKPDEVETATGFAPGAVAPFPLPGVTRILVERSLLSSPALWVGAGSDRHMATLTPVELLRLTHGEPVDLVQESA
jgi:prolyl-tRNA editing enzyme YbaK/EbsC (Cys-tRNA(Pro) deacylase)